MNGEVEARAALWFPSWPRMAAAMASAVRPVPVRTMTGRPAWRLCSMSS